MELVPAERKDGGRRAVPTWGMSPDDAEVVDRLFNAAWRAGFALRRRLVPGLADGASWAAMRLADGSEFVAGLEPAGSLDRLWTRPPYYMRLPGQEPEPVLGVEQASAFFYRGFSGCPPTRHPSSATMSPVLGGRMLIETQSHYVETESQSVPAFAVVSMPGAKEQSNG